MPACWASSIGVYLGRPFEGWTYQRIMEELGPIEYYVHERLGQPLVVTDDDVAGTFTFIRALEDYGIKQDLSAEEIGKAWLNYIIEGRTILWWGGNGVSTEHTAWLNLKRGIAGSGLRLDRDERAHCRGADRRADLHRRVGAWSRRASRSLPPGWPSRQARSAMTGRPCMRRCSGRRWKRRPSALPTSTTCSISGSRRFRATA